jgi:hypothetical protein
MTAYFAWCFLMLFLAVEGAPSIHQGSFVGGRVKGFCCEREFEQPEAFEKMYVQGSQILSMPAGTFLKLDNGDVEQVRALLADFQGMYVLRILTQCPLCGRCYRGKSSPDGYDCPLYDKEILPGLWTLP